MIPLKRLLDVLPEMDIRGNADISIRQITYDSRRVGPGDLFVALKGGQHDGHAYLREALRGGAACVVLEQNIDIPGIVRFARHFLVGTLFSSTFGH